MVKIRLMRIGKKKVPFYKIVVSDSRKPADGRFIEQIGTYNPHTDPGTVQINEEAALKWLSNGAQPTETVSRLLKQAGIKKGGSVKKAEEAAPVSAAAEETSEE